MTQENKANVLALPIILGLVLFVGAAALSWWTLPAERRGVAPEAPQEIAVQAEEAEVGEASRPEPVDVDAALAAIDEGGCAACHTIPNVPNAIGQVGPDLSKIGVEGATRIEGYGAEAYIRESLLEPNAFIAPECPFGPCTPGTMPSLQLDEAEIETIVNYLATLGRGDSESAGTDGGKETSEPR